MIKAKFTQNMEMELLSARARPVKFRSPANISWSFTAKQNSIRYIRTVAIFFSSPSSGWEAQMS